MPVHNNLLNRKKWLSGKVLQSFDSFGVPVPTFNIKGQDSVTTRTGGVVTILIVATVLLYATVKFNHLYTRHNPHLSSYFTDIAKTDSINLEEDPYYKEFKIAFSVEDYFSPKKLKNDPRYTKWIFRLFGKRDNVNYERTLSAHICTDEDYA